MCLVGAAVACSAGAVGESVVENVVTRKTFFFTFLPFVKTLRFAYVLGTLNICEKSFFELFCGDFSLNKKVGPID